MIILQSLDAIHMNDKIIETERLILRPFTDTDVEAVLEFNSHPEVVRYTGEEPLQTLEEAQSVINTVRNRDYNVQGYGRMAVVHKLDNKVIGFSGLKWEADIEETDIGYRFLPKYWGKGIATESCLPLLEYGFVELGLHRIVGLAYPANVASCKVLEKIGMQHYKTDYFPGDDKKCLWHKIENSNAKPIVVSKEINCTQEKAWSALTILDEMKKWYFDQIVAFEAKVGFATQFVIHNEGRTFTHKWKVVDLKPEESISCSWQYDEYKGISKATFRVEKIKQGVSVTVTCTGLETFPQDVPEFKSESCRGGWEYFLNRLKDYCEG